MKQYRVLQTDFNDGAKVLNNGIALLFGNLSIIGANTGLLTTNFVSGAESMLLWADDSEDETIIKGAGVNDWQSGNYIVGFAPRAIIERETTDYSIYDAISPVNGKVLFKGVLKYSKTEFRTLSLENEITAQFKIEI